MILKPAGYWFKQRGFTDSALDRRTATTTGQMLYQIIDPKPAQIDFTDNLPATPPSGSVAAANRRRETYNNRYSEHDNRNIIQNYGEYFGRGFGKRLESPSARRRQDWSFAHEPLPVHPDRSITQRDYRGLPALDNQRFSSASVSNAARRKSNGNWMTSSYDNYGRDLVDPLTSLVYHNDFKRMPIHPWHY